MKNLDNVVWAYEAYLANVGVYIDDISEINRLSRELQDNDIHNLCHRAFQELKRQYLLESEGSKKLLGYFLPKLKELLEISQEQVALKKLNHAKRLPIYKSYFDIVQPLYDLVDNIEALDEPESSNSASNSSGEEKSEKLSHKQVAMIHVYNGPAITRENSAMIAKRYGWMSKTSGESIYQSYTRFYPTSNRIFKDDSSVTKTKNRIQLLESISNYIESDSKLEYEDHLKTLRASA